MPQPESTAQRTGPPAKPPEPPEARPPVPFTQLLGRVVVGAAAVLFLLFTLFNRHSVTVDWVVGTWDVPLIVVLLGSFLLGVLVGSSWLWRRQRLRSARRRQEERTREDERRR
ncbi:MAG: lipopolysaccharide assembly protein LapA domain-containing protein [Nitriliruptorales bacterium]